MKSFEEWRPCPGFEDAYEVSSLGRVKRIKAARRAIVGTMLIRLPHTNAEAY